MKKILALFAVAVLGSALIGCGAKEDEAATTTGTTATAGAATTGTTAAEKPAATTGE